MSEAIIGRSKELKKLQKLYESNQAQFLAVYGRRRVGKTYLIRQFFADADCIFFQLTGLKDGGMDEQLALFNKSLKRCFYPKLAILQPKNWMQAFETLTDAIDNVPPTKKIVLFFDELPWLATKRSKLVQALDHYWNTTWSLNKNIKLIVCGSAASWMINTFVKAKGGLYNRITSLIKLLPFNLLEVEQYFKSKHINLGRQQILHLYMSLGGIPYYLQAVEKGKSATQAVSDLCFQTDGLLYNEYEKLFDSLFENAKAYEELVELIATKKRGLTKVEILKKAKLATSGGTLNDRLVNLQESGFINCYQETAGSKKNVYYRVVDEFTLFYLTWLGPAKKELLEEDNHYWELQTQTQAYKAWAGLSFEGVCFKHIGQIKKKLAIEHVTLKAYTWRFSPEKHSEETGTQLDIVLERQDDIINICESKLYAKQFVIDKDYSKKLLNKIEIFKNQTKTGKHIFLIIITANGLQQNQYARELVSGEVVLDDLFS